MSQLISKPFANILLKRSAGAIGMICLGGLITLSSCAPRSDNASIPSEAPNAQVQANPDSTASSETPAPASDSPADMTVDPNVSLVLDNQLIVRGAQDNLFEIEAGQLAAQKAENAEVKQFAQRMVQDHTQATDALQQVATERNVTLPTDMGDQNQAILARLSDLSGAEFDRAYMTEMVNSHQKDVDLVRNQAQNGKDQELKSLAAQKLPALENHLKMAQTLAQQLEG